MTWHFSSALRFLDPPATWCQLVPLLIQVFSKKVMSSGRSTEFQWKTRTLRRSSPYWYIALYFTVCMFLLDPLTHISLFFKFIISLWDLLHDSNLRFVSFYWNRISLSHLPGTVRWGCNFQSDPRHQRQARSWWHRGNMHPAIGIPAFGRRGFLWFNLQHRIIRTKWKGGIRVT